MHEFAWIVASLGDAVVLPGSLQISGEMGVVLAVRLPIRNNGLIPNNEAIRNLGLLLAVSNLE